MFAMTLVGCEQNKDLETIKQSFNFDKTEIIFGENTTYVDTKNHYSDFSSNELIIGENITVTTNGYLQSLNDKNLWFLPFDEDEEPILLSRRGDVGPNIIDNPPVINCNCPESTLNICHTTSQGNPDGSITITCDGFCFNLSTETTSKCDMSITYPASGKETSTSILMGMIVSSNEISFNNKIYTASKK